jgi:hypothetical protein
LRGWARVRRDGGQQFGLGAVRANKKRERGDFMENEEKRPIICDE